LAEGGAWRGCCGCHWQGRANDLPNPVRFSKTALDLIEAAAKAANGEHLRVAACGESASTLWGQGKAAAAVQLEHL
jgi:hypothetical protein